jgi:hypothetical protein
MPKKKGIAICSNVLARNMKATHLFLGVVISTRRMLEADLEWKLIRKVCPVWRTDVNFHFFIVVLTESVSLQFLMFFSILHMRKSRIFAFPWAYHATVRSWPGASVWECVEVKRY